MATNQLSEQEIQFRKRARRRLVGAIALVLLMVTVLPMLLDDREVKPTPQDIAITIPSQDGTGFSSRIVPAAPLAEPAVADRQSLPLAPPLEKPQPSAGQEKKVIPAPAAPSARLQEKPLPVAQPEPVPAQAPAQKSVEPVVAAKSKPIPVAAAPKGTFLLQIGVFTDTPKLKQLEGKLAAQGFRAIREKLNTPKGTKIRLRTGPYPTRAEAEAAQAKLKAAGMDGMVVANK